MHQVYTNQNTAITRIAAMWKTAGMLHWGGVAGPVGSEAPIDKLGERASR